MKILRSKFPTCFQVLSAHIGIAAQLPDTCDFRLKGAGTADHPGLYLPQPSNQIDFHS